MLTILSVLLAANCDFKVELTADSRLLRYLKSKNMVKYELNIEQKHLVRVRHKKISGNQIGNISPGQTIFFSQIVGSDKTGIKQCRHFRKVDWIVDGKSCGTKQILNKGDAKTATWDSCAAISVPDDFEKDQKVIIKKEPEVEKSSGTTDEDSKDDDSKWNSDESEHESEDDSKWSNDEEVVPARRKHNRDSDDSHYDNDEEDSPRPNRRKKHGPTYTDDAPADNIPAPPAISNSPPPTRYTSHEYSPARRTSDYGSTSDYGKGTYQPVYAGRPSGYKADYGYNH